MTRTDATELAPHPALMVRGPVECPPAHSAALLLSDAPGCSQPPTSSGVPPAADSADSYCALGACGGDQSPAGGACATNRSPGSGPSCSAVSDSADSGAIGGGGGAADDAEEAGVDSGSRMGTAGLNKSRYRGVSYDKKKRKWRVQIKVASLGKSGVSVGYYDTEQAAARAYDRAAVGLLGRNNANIVTNFPLEEYDNEEVPHLIGKSREEVKAALKTERAKLQTPRRRFSGKQRTSKYLGVGSSNRKSQWQARILVDGKITHLGYYESEEQAARVYDRVSISLHGSSAQTNFGCGEYAAEDLAEFRGLGREELQRALGVRPMDKAAVARARSSAATAGTRKRKGKWGGAPGLGEEDDPEEEAAPDEDGVPHGSGGGSGGGGLRRTRSGAAAKPRGSPAAAGRGTSEEEEEDDEEDDDALFGHHDALAAMTRPGLHPSKRMRGGELPLTAGGVDLSLDIGLVGNLEAATAAGGLVHDPMFDGEEEVMYGGGAGPGLAGRGFPRMGSAGIVGSPAAAAAAAAYLGEPGLAARHLAGSYNHQYHPHDLAAALAGSSWRLSGGGVNGSKVGHGGSNGIGGGQMPGTPAAVDRPRMTTRGPGGGSMQHPRPCSPYHHGLAAAVAWGGSKGQHPPGSTPPSLLYEAGLLGVHQDVGLDFLLHGDVPGTTGWHAGLDAASSYLTGLMPGELSTVGLAKLGLGFEDPTDTKIMDDFLAIVGAEW